MILHHWNQFLALESDLNDLTRYIEFATDNFSTYSTELATLLMTTTQETDVVLHLICAHHGGSASNEGSFRRFLPPLYPNLSSYEVTVPRWELSFIPFTAWTVPATPAWWTANNKVKHERGTHFRMANLESVLNACGALLLVNILYYNTQAMLDELVPSPRLLGADDLAASVSATQFGLMVNYHVPGPSV